MDGFVDGLVSQPGLDTRRLQALDLAQIVGRVSRETAGDFVAVARHDRHGIAELEVAIDRDDARRAAGSCRRRGGRARRRRRRRACPRASRRTRSSACATTARRSARRARTAFRHRRRRARATSTSGSRPGATTAGTPVRVTMRAEPTLLAMPPEPTPLVEPPATGAASRSMSRTIGIRTPLASRTPSTSVRITSASARDEVAHERGELIVVAELDLLGRDRVVLVDDRHDAVIEQRAQRQPRRQEAPAIAEVVVGDEHLADLDVVRARTRAPSAASAAIWPTAAAACSAGISVGRASAAAGGMPSAIAPDDDDHDLDVARAAARRPDPRSSRAGSRGSRREPAADLHDDALARASELARGSRSSLEGPGRHARTPAPIERLDRARRGTG